MGAYVYRGTGRDTLTEGMGLEALRALELRTDLAEAMEIGPGPEWRREVEAEAGRAAVPVRRPAAVLAQAAEPEAVPPPVAVGEQCPVCLYLTSAIGHKITCGVPDA